MEHRLDNIDEYKKVLGKYPTGVTIISTKYEDTLHGFTANSFTSVSLKPAIVSFCLDNNSKSFIKFKQSNNFSISILANDQQNIASHFAQKIVGNKFDKIKHFAGKYSDSPLIEDATGFIECQKMQQIACGDHHIFLGKVLSLRLGSDKLPLVYFARSFRTVSETII